MGSHGPLHDDHVRVVEPWRSRFASLVLRKRYHLHLSTDGQLCSEARTPMVLHVGVHSCTQYDRSYREGRKPYVDREVDSLFLAPSSTKGTMRP